MSLTAMQAGSGRIVKDVVNATFVPKQEVAGQRQQMMKVEYPETFKDLKDVEVRIESGPFLLSLLDFTLAAIVINSVIATVTLK